MNEILYINSASSYVDKINRIDVIIDSLMLQMTNVRAGNSDVQSYKINDGQTVLETEYTSIELIENAITGFERMRERYVNKLNGHSFILRDWRGLR